MPKSSLTDKVGSKRFINMPIILYMLTLKQKPGWKHEGYDVWEMDHEGWGASLRNGKA